MLVQRHTSITRVRAVVILASNSDGLATHARTLPQLCLVVHVYNCDVYQFNKNIHAHNQ